MSDNRKIRHQRKIHVDIVSAAGGYIKWPPTAVIFPLKCGRWYFQNADGRENTAKLWPLDSKNAFHRPRPTI